MGVRQISEDILEYLYKKEKMSINEIAESMGTDPDYIKNAIKGRKTLTIDHINYYTSHKGIHFWEFALAAIPLNHLSEKIRNRILLCKQLSDHIKKKTKSS